MARRPSAVSVSSVASSSGLPHISKSSPQLASPLQKFRTPSSPWPPRSVSFSALSHQGPSGDVVDPDELFTKYTVAEVKTVQNRLRADADAKQEELRLMVGERYRDLLQASTSIISIAQSSQRVLDALEDMKISIPSPEEAPQLNRRSNLSGKDDSHLRMLQSLAAHMKLLLDTPEHLWRLLEKKKYLYAGWLFLLARVIHRALVREDSEDEGNWKAHGIDILEQFPLVQRQWDTVAQFRAQITYKATLSLREFNTSVNDVCSILLTLHLLESRPLTDTLSTFLGQRTRSLQTSLSRNPKITTNGQSSQLPNGTAGVKARKSAIRDVRDGFEGALEVIALTVGAAREIFRDQSSSQPSLMGLALQFIQSDSVPEEILAPDLQMSTQHLLSSLPSASHFSLLPPSIRLYKPYVDLTSSTSSIPPAQLAERLRDWFQKAVQDLQTAAEAWLADLKTLKDVWTIRIWVNNWVQTDARFEEGERIELRFALDVLVHKQAAQIWTSSLSDMQQVFQSELTSALSALRQGTSEGLLEASPAKYLFQTAPTPSSFDASQGSSSMVSSFRKYESALRRQVAGRTPLLDKVMNSLESHAAALHDDVQAVNQSESGDPQLSVKLKVTYQPCAEKSFVSILDAVSSNIAGVSNDFETDVRVLAYLSRLADEMSSSQFLTDLQLGTNAGSHFHEKIQALHELGIDRWRLLTVRSIVVRYRETRLAASHMAHTHGTDLHASGSDRPSSSLMEALLAVSNSVQTVATFTRLRRPPLAEEALRNFISLFLDELDEIPVDAQRNQDAVLWDLRFLRRLSELWGPGWKDIQSQLNEKTNHLRPKSLSNGSANPSSDDDGAVSEHLARTQVLLAPILPPPPSPLPPTKSAKKDVRPESLLLFGAPVVEQQVQPAMELVKPGPRFGLILVGSTSIR